MLGITQVLHRFAVWCRAGRRDLQAAHAPRLTPAYRARQEAVKRMWMGAGLCMLLNPIVPVVAVIGLFTSCHP
jgi:hypothetical protein